MGMFKVPDNLIEEIHSILNKFWWGNGRERKMHWKGWFSLCMPKKCGGMGFRDLRIFNHALLAKQDWRLLQHNNTLVYKVLKARYFKHSSFLEARRGFNPSYTWRSIWGAKALLEEGLQWRIGNGHSVKVWTDNWVPGIGNSGTPIPHANGLHDNDLKVEGLIDWERRCWNHDALALHLHDEDTAVVLTIPLISAFEPDSLY
ncbi:uncharacterized protein LOC110697934 [Chenopodium quinoa]|uniref:uncharacterized protein LOC110697934 n=1 Tax=Chenopodium quinoa TaxID=63459 RepID=UPI000B78564F|nr:uncharacterized protein LOC110697934 [Chenopodium quinoa]